MSAYVVSHQIIDRVMVGILALTRYEYLVVPDAFPDGMDPKEAGTEIGRAMLHLNIDAVSWRYPGDLENNELPGPDVPDIRAYADAYLCKVERTERTPLELTDSLKALHCWLYQTNEGDYSETPLYRELKRIAGRIAEAIVERGDAYDKAPWDAD